MKYCWPSMSAGSTSMDSMSCGLKIFRKNNSRKLIEYAAHWQLFTQHLLCIYSYLHSIYIVLGIIVSRSVMSSSLRFHGLQAAKLLCLWNFPGKNTGVGSHSLLQVIFLTQGSNPGLLHGRQILYSLSYEGSPQCRDELKCTVGYKQMLYHFIYGT